MSVTPPSCPMLTNGALAVALATFGGTINFGYDSFLYKQNSFTYADKTRARLGEIEPDAIIKYIGTSLGPVSGCKALLSIKTVNLSDHAFEDKHIPVLKHILENYPTLKPTKIMLGGSAFSSEGQTQITAYLAEKGVIGSFQEGGARRRYKSRRRKNMKRRRTQRHRHVR